MVSQAALPTRNKGLLTLAVMGASIMQILDSTIANVAIPHMQTSLSATRDSVTWVLTSYIIASAVAIPVTGWLSDRYGSRRLFLVAVTGFLIASMMCGAATDLSQMVIFRIFQGICSAFIGPLSQTILLDINPPERAPQAMAMWGMGIMIAPIMGPVIGGWLTENYNWRWVFYINLPIGIPTLAILWWLLPSRALIRRGLDLAGFAMLALGLATLQLLLDRGQHVDWFNSWEIWIECIIAVSALWMFLIRQLTAEKPMFSRALVTNSNFLTALGFMILVGMMMLGVFALFPPMLQSLFGYSVLDTGILLVPRGLGILASMFLATRLISRMDSRYLVGSGFALMIYSLWLMTHWSLDIDWHPIVITGVIQGLGMGLVFIPMNSLAFATVSNELRTDGSSLLFLLRSLGGSMGISVMTAALARNTQISHQDLASHITAYSLSSVDPSSADRLGAIGEVGLRVIDAEITRQAAMIAYLNDFKLMMFVVIACLGLVFLLKPAPRRA